MEVEKEGWDREIDVCADKAETEMCRELPPSSPPPYVGLFLSLLADTTENGGEAAAGPPKERPGAINRADSLHCHCAVQPTFSLPFAVYSCQDVITDLNAEGEPIPIRPVNEDFIAHKVRWVFFLVSSPPFEFEKGRYSAVDIRFGPSPFKRKTLSENNFFSSENRTFDFTEISNA